MYLDKNNNKSILIVNKRVNKRERGRAVSQINEGIRQLRKQKGYTMEALAEKSGYTKGYLSRIENAETPPPFATVERILAALGSDISELVPQQEGEPSHNIDLMGQGEVEQTDWDAPEAVYAFKPLLHYYKNKQMAPFLFRVKTGSTERYGHDAEEFVYVLRGTVTLHYEKKAYLLREGDCFYLDARIKHNFVNDAAETALLIAVHYNYRRF